MCEKIEENLYININKYKKPKISCKEGLIKFINDKSYLMMGALSLIFLLIIFNICMISKV